MYFKAGNRVNGAITSVIACRRFIEHFITAWIRYSEAQRQQILGWMYEALSRIKGNSQRFIILIV